MFNILKMKITNDKKRTLMFVKYYFIAILAVEYNFK